METVGGFGRLQTSSKHRARCYDQPLGNIMQNKKLEERIVRDPGICGGEPVFRGTRVPLRTVLASLAEGDLPETILAEFPG